jgi:cell division protein FtsQ
MISGFFALVGFVEVEQKTIKCTRIGVNINYQESEIFITNEEVIDEVNSLYDSGVVNKAVVDISNLRIKERLLQNPYIAEVTVYTTVDGVLKVHLTQRKPILRVFNSLGQSFYIASDGQMIPLSDKYTARVPVANGIISEEFSANRSLLPGLINWDDASIVLTNLQKLYVLAMYVDQDNFYKMQVDQIYVNAYREFEITPKVGKHTILFGDINNIPEKFTKLTAFYREGLKKSGWNKYKTLNIKYKNQVICSKN